ncbi:hypothetical protein Q0P28_14030, partial [Staphylococcus aureus]|nr:hypothetical protein [Staphylococcus aureus]
SPRHGQHLARHGQYGTKGHGELPDVLGEVSFQVVGRKLTRSFTDNIDFPETPRSLSGAAPEESKTYIDQIRGMKDYELTTLYIDFT